VPGPIARTATDLELLLRTMAGYDDRAPLSLHGDPGRRPPLPGARVAWFGDLGGYLPMDPGILEVTTAALDRFTELGMTVDTFDELPSAGAFTGNESLWPAWISLRRQLAGLAVKPFHDVPAWRGLLKPEALYEYEGLAGLSAVDIAEGAALRSGLYEAFRLLFQRYDYAVLPTAQVWPFDAAEHWPARIGDTVMPTYHRWMEVTTIATLINAPALAVPAGFSAAGLPIGLQIIGRNHDDYALTALAVAWERQTATWRRTLPPLVR
jgi:amidase